MNKSWRLSLVAMLFLDCGSKPLPDPRVLSLTPSTMVASDTLQATVVIDAVLPFELDYGATSANVDTRLGLWVGDVPVPPAEYVNQGRLPTEIPSMFSPGTYDLRLELADGREGRLEHALTVLPGAWPDSYSIDHVADQVVGQPFVIHVQAKGANASAFHGTVTLSLSRGTITPVVSNSFDGGFLDQTVVITSVQKSQAQQIAIHDAVGATANSNAFDVQ